MATIVIISFIIIIFLKVEISDNFRSSCSTLQKIYIKMLHTSY